MEKKNLKPKKSGRTKPTQDAPSKWGMRDYGYLPKKENPNKWGGRA